jgi:hypothetical protein
MGNAGDRADVPNDLFQPPCKPPKLLPLLPIHGSPLDPRPCFPNLTNGVTRMANRGILHRATSRRTRTPSGTGFLRSAERTATVSCPW